MSVAAVAYLTVGANDGLSNGLAERGLRLAELLSQRGLERPWGTLVAWAREA